MKIKLILLYSLIVFLGSCGNINKAMKTTNLDYKYEAAKQYYMMSKYENSCLLLNDVIAGMKGTEKGDESLFLYGMGKYLNGDLQEANEYLTKYYQTYPSGHHVEEACFYSACALYEATPNENLDQTDTYLAVTEFQNFLEAYPDSKYAEKSHQMIFELQDKLVEKQYLAAKLYYNLGDYFGNCTMGGSNYEACIITAQNAIKDYPYATKKEEFSIMILRAKYELAQRSIVTKQSERYSDTVDEYYGFVNEYPNSKYLDEAKKIFEKSKSAIK